MSSNCANAPRGHSVGLNRLLRIMLAVSVCALLTVLVGFLLADQRLVLGGALVSLAVFLLDLPILLLLRANRN